MKLSRAEAEGHLADGRPVAFKPEGGEPRTLARGEGFKNRTASLPPENEKGEYTLLCDERGNLTRAGMENAIRQGGSVMLDGNMIETIDDLPTEAQLAKGDERRTQAARQRLREKQAELDREMATLDAPEETRVQAGPSSQAAPTGHPAPPQHQGSQPGQRPATPSQGPGVRHEERTLGETRQPKKDDKGK